MPQCLEVVPVDSLKTRAHSLHQVGGRGLLGHRALSIADRFIRERSERVVTPAPRYREGLRPGAWAEDGETIALSARCRRVGVIGADARRSSQAGVSCYRVG